MSLAANGRWHNIAYANSCAAGGGEPEPGPELRRRRSWISSTWEWLAALGGGLSAAAGCLSCERA